MSKRNILRVNKVTTQNKIEYVKNFKILKIILNLTYEKNRVID